MATTLTLSTRELRRHHIVELLFQTSREGSAFGDTQLDVGGTPTFENIEDTNFIVDHVGNVN